MVHLVITIKSLGSHQKSQCKMGCRMGTTSFVDTCMLQCPYPYHCSAQTCPLECVVHASCNTGSILPLRTSDLPHS